MIGNESGSVRVLVVDDESNIREALKAFLTFKGYLVQDHGDGEGALEAFRSSPFPLVLTDLMMPGLTGEDLLLEIKKIDPTAEVVVMTGHGTINSAVSTLRAGAYDYIIKPFKMESLLRALEKAKRHRDLIRENRRLQENSLNVLRTMVNVLEHRDAYTAGHSQRVTEITLAVATGIGLPEEEIKTLRLAGLIHDLGKIGIDDHILRKPGRLDEEEYGIIKSHPEKGVQMIEPLDFLKDTIPVILHHHERYDGSGYPSGLRGEEIPLGARIITIADTFDAMTSSRAYRSARSTGEATDELIRCKGTQFDAEIVGIFLDISRTRTFDGVRPPGDEPSLPVQ